MSNPWDLSRLASASPPSSSSTGDKRNLIPPDPPDPTPTLSLELFPVLSPTTSSKRLNRTRGSVLSTESSPFSHSNQTAQQPSVAGPSLTADTEMELEIVSGSVPSPRSETTVAGSVTDAHSNSTVNLTVLPPKTSSPLQTNKAISPTHLSTANSSNHHHSNATDTNRVSATLPPNPVTAEPNPASAPTQSGTQPKAHSFPTLVEKIRRFEDKSLKRLAPATTSATGRPTVLIPDEVFQKGAALHKDFIVCIFNGRPPPYSQIQSVLNHMWGKGTRLEIHNNPASRSLLVRITSDYLKEKILEKGYWYVGDSMFHTEQWTSTHSTKSPSFKSIQIWAHLTGIPLDLRHQDGLSLVAGLVGEPKETDDFTKNLVSLSLSHAKVEVDLTKALPDVVEFTRQSGEVVEVTVSYPWLPPTCSHCKEMGHIAKNCLLIPLPQKNPPIIPPSKTPSKTSTSKTPAKNPSKTPSVPYYRPKTIPIKVTGDATGVNSPGFTPLAPFADPLSPSLTVPPPTLPSTSSSPAELDPPLSLNNTVLASPPKFTSPSKPSRFTKIKTLATLSPITSPLTKQPSLNIPSPTYQPSLKRSRSDPSLSPPNSLSLLTSSLKPPIYPLTSNHFSLLAFLDSSQPTRESAPPS